MFILNLQANVLNIYMVHRNTFLLCYANLGSVVCQLLRVRAHIHIHTQTQTHTTHGWRADN